MNWIRFIFLCDVFFSYFSFLFREGVGGIIWSGSRRRRGCGLILGLLRR